MTRPNTITINDRTDLGPLLYDDRGRPYYAIFGTDGDDLIKANRSQEYDDRGQKILLAFFGLGGDDIIFQAPNPRGAEAHYYGNTGGGGRGTSFPSGPVGQSRGEYDQIHIGGGGLSNSFDPRNWGQTDTILHGGHYAKPARIHRFDPEDDRIMAEADAGWKLAGFRFYAESSGGGDHRAVVDSLTLHLRDSNPILDRQAFVVKFNDGARPVIDLDGDGNHREEVRELVRDFIADDVFVL